MADVANHGFTPEQVVWLDRRFGAARSFDRITIMWLVGGLFALGLAMAGVVWTEIGSVRGEIASVRGEIASVRGEIRSVRGEIGSVRRELGAKIDANTAAIAELAKGLASIEAILQERLPRR